MKIYPIYGPIAAAPSLHMALQHIARSPLARLGISYQIVPHSFCEAPWRHVFGEGLRHGATPLEAEVLAEIGDRQTRLPEDPQFCLGEAIYLYSILAGGVDGQPLPVAVCRRMDRLIQNGPLGMLDVVA